MVSRVGWQAATSVTEDNTACIYWV